MTVQAGLCRPETLKTGFLASQLIIQVTGLVLTSLLSFRINIILIYTVNSERLARTFFFVNIREFNASRIQGSF